MFHLPELYKLLKIEFTISRHFYKVPNQQMQCLPCPAIFRMALTLTGKIAIQDSFVDYFKLAYS